MLRESGASIVIIGGWAAFTTEALKNGPLKGLSKSIIGTAPQALSQKESVAGWLSCAGDKHRYIILSTTPTDDTRAVQVNPLVGLSREDVERALEILS